MFVVSIMPCTAKKYEAERMDHTAVKGLPDIDVSLTTRELARMIKKAGILFSELPDSEFDAPFGLGSGAGTIFGATGGVMEAALRTAAEILTGKPLEKVEFEDVRGTKGIKKRPTILRATRLECRGVRSHNAKKLLDMVKSGEKKYDFIEISLPALRKRGGRRSFRLSPQFTDVKKVRPKRSTAMTRTCPSENHMRTRYQRKYIKSISRNRAAIRRIRSCTRATPQNRVLLESLRKAAQEIRRALSQKVILLIFSFRLCYYIPCWSDIRV